MEDIKSLIGIIIFLIFSTSMLNFSVSMKKLGAHMRETGYIKANFFWSGHPAHDVKISKFYSFLYYYNFVISIFLLRIFVIFLTISFFLVFLQFLIRLR
jgi:hypothetical protein